MPMPEQSLSSELEQYCVVEGCNSNREYMMGKLLYNIFVSILKEMYWKV